MNKEKHMIELPLIEPLYSTYHAQGTGTSTLTNNPSIRNWYLNEVMNITCTTKFLTGFTTPEINIENSAWDYNPYIEMKLYNMEFIKIIEN